jgi:hypothetical protein
MLLLSFWQSFSRIQKNGSVKLFGRQTLLRDGASSTSSNTQTVLACRVTGLGEFSLTIVYFGYFFENYGSITYFWGTFFPPYKLRINFDKIWVGLHLGGFFHKLIWSPRLVVKKLSMAK